MTVADDHPPGVAQSRPEDGRTASNGGFDLDSAGSVNAPRPRRGTRRSLPVWALVAMAVFFGWLLGTLLGSSTSASTDVGIELEPAAVAPTPSAPDSIELPAPGAPVLPLPNATLVLAEQFDDGSAPAMITLIDSFGTSSVRLRNALPGPGPDAGQTGQRVQVSRDTIAFVADDQVLSIDVAATQSLLPVTTASVLLGGPGGDTLWAVEPTSRLVKLVDATSGSARATYDLSGVGDVLGSYDGGLLVAPDIERFGAFALWSPARGIERLWSLDEQARYLDAAASTVVVHTAQGLASYDTVTGALTQTDRMLTGSEIDNAWVGPGGDRIAVIQDVESQPAGERGAIVQVVDLASGDIVDTFQTEEPSLVHWVSATDLVHLEPGDQRQIRLRDTSLGFATTLTQAQSTIAWIVVVEH